MYKLDPEIIEFLPMGVDDTAIPKDRKSVKAKIRHELNIGDKDFIVITGGKIDERKNTHILLKALSSLNNKHVHLIICGTLTPEMEYLKEQFTPNIHYLGWCNAERVMNCMVAADLACFPGTHSTLWEQAVGVGLPSIFKHWNEMTHVNVDNNCIFVKGDDEVELEEVIKNLVFTEQYDTMKSQAEKTSKEFLYSIIAAKSIQEP
jgi:glycosyltransferase involved in cell wall biosynthesis